MSDGDREFARRKASADDRMVIPGIAMLALILPSGTEPPSSAMTNASAVRSFTIAKKKPTRRSRAKAAFDRAELELESYYRIEVSLERISTKAKAAESVAALYRRVIAVNDPEHTLAFLS